MGLTGKVGGGGAQKMEMERLRREDHLRVKHDKLFSEWKILVGPADWNDHTAGEEGSQRYRLHNLPSSYFGPGVYELGLTQHATTEDSKHGKLRRHAVVVVYLGQADNVRQRLQRYGQTGSHLEGGRSALCSAIDEDVKVKKLDENVEVEKFAPQPIDPRAKLRGWWLQPEPTASRETSTTCNIHGGLRLFTEVFSRGYSVAFRWARTESKQMAEKVESELLHVFDYPWNTMLNGSRRPRDILAKLDMLQLQLDRSLCLGRVVGIGSRKWAYFGRKVGISVPARKPAEPPPAKIPTSFFFSSAKRRDADDGVAAISVCGVPFDDGSACRHAPVKGRKRCPAHKGQRREVSTRRRSRPRDQPDPQQDSNGAETVRTSIQGSTGSSNGSITGTNRIRNTGIEIVSDAQIRTGSDWGTALGREMGSETGKNASTGTDVGRSTGSTGGNDTGRRSMGHGRTSNTGSSTPTVVVIRAQMQGKRVEITDIASDGLGLGFRGCCGAILEGGSSCMNPPVHGRRRCATHKGMRISKHNPKGSAGEEDAECSGFSGPTSHRTYSVRSPTPRTTALR